MNNPNLELYDPDVYVAGVPHESMRWLRDNDPVHWHAHPDGGGFWLLSRHADVLAASRDYRTFSTERGFVMIDELPSDILAQTQNQLLGMDPPRHGPIRRVVIERFTQRMLEQLEPEVRAITRALISSGMHELIARPELYRALEADPSGLPLAIEEMLRWSTPLHHFRRTATRDCELHGRSIRENDRVVLLYSSANFDERVFEEPQRFDICRTPNPHLAFGHGIHFCLGANLARLEARVFFEEFLRSFAGIEETALPARIRSNLVNGFKRMPVRLHARQS